MHKNKFNSNVRIYNSQRIKIAYLAVSVRTPPSLVPLSTKSNSSVYIFSIDKETGGIYHGGFPNIDIFPSEIAFTKFLKSIYPEIFDQEDLGSHLIGATVSNNQLVIACVKEKEEVAIIFNQPIYKITSVNYKNLPLWNNIQPSSTILHDFNICYNHFFCPTLNISARFPYPKNIISNGPFCWNKRFLMPFEENHALHACIIVLQGAVFSMSKEYKSGYNIFYIIKRSAMFPGTRYNARGLNSPVDPANECECDLIFLANNKYYAQSWRRGSPPVLWETEIKNLVIASHVVKANANNDTPMYFLNSIIQRFESEKVCVISLLQQHGQEQNIDNVYSEGVQTLSNVFPNVAMKYISFDLNALLKEKGIIGMVSDFYSAINDDINNSNFTVVDCKTGKYEISSEDNKPKRQKTVFRFNCADSLDRTNVATFFYSLVLCAKFINKTGNVKFKKPNINGDIDLKNPIESLNHDVIDFLGDCFIESGNIISLMYTNTDAIKTHLIRYFMTPTKEGTKDSDKVVSVYRRFQNCVLDGQRQAIIEEWTSSNFKNSKFTLDEQHISLVTRSVYEKTLITHQILESPIRKLSVFPKSDNAIIVMFPEPFLLCSFSIFIVPNLITSLFNITLTVDSTSTSHSLYFHNINLPHFLEYRKVSSVEEANDNKEKEVKGMWVTYDIRKMAKQSNYFPIEPLCLQPTLFVSIRSAAFCKELNLSNISFTVKRPTNPRKCFYITGIPPEIEGKSFSQNAGEIYKNLIYREQTLSELRSIELSRIENGINDYFRNNYLVKLKRNPWIYDIRAYTVRKTKDNCCIICGEKTNDYDKYPPFFIPDSQYPISYVKTDKLDASNKKRAIVLCKNCKSIFDDQIQIQLIVLKNVSSKALINVNEYVGFLSSTFSRYESGSFEISHLAKVFLSTFENTEKKQLQRLVTGGDAAIEMFGSQETQRLILCFPASVCLDTLTINLKRPVPADSLGIGLRIYDDKKAKKAKLTKIDTKNAKDVANSKNDINNGSSKDEKEKINDIKNNENNKEEDNNVNKDDKNGNSAKNEKESINDDENNKEKDEKEKESSNNDENDKEDNKNENNNNGNDTKNEKESISDNENNKDENDNNGKSSTNEKENNNGNDKNEKESNNDDESNKEEKENSNDSEDDKNGNGTKNEKEKINDNENNEGENEITNDENGNNNDNNESNTKNNKNAAENSNNESKSDNTEKSNNNENEISVTQNDENESKPTKPENLMKTKFQFKINDDSTNVTSIQILFKKKRSTLLPSNDETQEKGKDDDDADDDNNNNLDTKNSNEIRHILSSLQITGTFKYVSSREFLIESTPKLKIETDQNQEQPEKTKEKKDKKDDKNDLPRFSESRCAEWSATFRTQKYKYTKKKTIRGYAIKPPQSKENRAHSLILAFYNNDKYVSHEPVVIPHIVDNDEIMYFPVSSRPSDFNNIVVFYLDRIPTVEPYKFMFFD